MKATSTLSTWVKASRPPAQSYIFMPLLMGQAFAMSVGATLDWTVFSLVHLIGVFFHLYIVYANDYADLETDRRNQTHTIFSGGSRVLVEGRLTPSALRRAAIIMAASAVIVGFSLFAFFGRFIPLLAIVFGLSLLWMYCYPPVRLSYRGGGELLQMMGVGVVLPVIGFFSQRGEWHGFPWFWVAAVLPAQLASGIATSLPDETSDRESSKKTLTVRLGKRIAMGATLLLNALAIGMVAILFRHRAAHGEFALWTLPAIGALMAAFFVFLHLRSTQRKWLTVFVALSVFVPLYLTGMLSWAGFWGDVF